MRMRNMLKVLSRSKKSGRIALLTVTFALIGCHPTELLQEGKTKFYKDSKIDKIAVIAFPGQLMEITTFEDIVAKSISSKNVTAKQGYVIYRDAEIIPSDAQSLRKDLKDKGYTGMIEVKLVSIRNVETNTAADYPTNRFYRITDVTNYSKLVQEYSKREEKGATFEDVKVKMDFRVVDLNLEEAQVVWSARTETSNPKTAKNVAQGMSKNAVKAMRKNAILGQ